jgi:hypothetical protein
MRTINYTIDDCPLMEFNAGINSLNQKIQIVRNGIEIPFQMKRMYYLYDIPLFQKRGGHAHKKLQQIIIAIIGSFTVKLDDGSLSKIVTLDQPATGLHLVPGIWRELVNFSPGAVCMVLASEVYDENDYIREYDEFLSFKQIMDLSERSTEMIQ